MMNDNIFSGEKADILEREITSLAVSQISLLRNNLLFISECN